MKNNRIAIAELSAFFSSDAEFDERKWHKLYEFLSNNDSNVVYLDLSFDDFKRLDSTSVTFDDSAGGGGWVINIGSGGEPQLSNGLYYLEGFFIPKLLHGIHQGYTETYIEHLDNSTIALSDKYVFKRHFDR